MEIIVVVFVMVMKLMEKLMKFREWKEGGGCDSGDDVV